jgi:alanyl-tRNA synthetase
VVEIKQDTDVFSAELCGGTHVHHTGEIGFLHVVKESAVAAGTRRIEALSGRAAEAHLVEQQERIVRLAERLNTTPADLEERVDALQAELEHLRKQAEELERLRAASIAEGLVQGATAAGDSHFVAALVDAASQDTLKDVADRVRQRLKSALVVLAAEINGRPGFLVALTPDLRERGVDAVKLINEIAAVAGGRGGGRPDLAQAGAKDSAKVGDALALARSLAAAALEG